MEHHITLDKRLSLSPAWSAKSPAAAAILDLSFLFFLYFSCPLPLCLPPSPLLLFLFLHMIESKYGSSSIPLLWLLFSFFKAGY